MADTSAIATVNYR